MVKCQKCGKQMSFGEYLLNGRCKKCINKENERKSNMNGKKVFKANLESMTYYDLRGKIQDQLSSKIKKIKSFPCILEVKHSHSFVKQSEDRFLFIDESGNVIDHLFKEEEIISAIDDCKNDLYKVYDYLSKELVEMEIKKEASKIQDRKYKLMIKEEAEKRVYGKKKNERDVISKEEKEMIFDKFNNECAICGAQEGLHIHHKDQNPSNNKTSNLIVLCGVCHKKVHMKVR